MMAPNETLLLLLFSLSDFPYKNVFMFSCDTYIYIYIFFSCDIYIYRVPQRKHQCTQTRVALCREPKQIHRRGILDPVS
jgi:hypothetical protein